MNKFIGIGRLTRDPDIRTSQSGTLIARFNLAVDRRFKKDGEQNADFIQCIAFGKTAELAEKYFRKGLKIAVEGRIQTGSYKNREGHTVYTTDVIVEAIDFCESKAKEQKAEQKNDDGFMDIPDDIDEELPFS